MPLMTGAIEVAAHIINHEHSQNRKINNIRLQKLLYFTQAESFVKYNRPLFVNDIEAWSFGPVVPSVYRPFKPYGLSDLPDQKEEICGYLTWFEKKMIDEVCDYFKDISTPEMTRLTKKQQPWRGAYHPRMKQVIAQNAICEFFHG